MKVLWLGHGGLLFVSGKKKILVDPYLSNSLRKEDRAMSRRIRINKKLFRVRPSIIILTNSSPDHTDIKTLSKYINRSRKNKITVLCCENSFSSLKDVKECAKGNRVMFSEGDEWTLDNLHIKAVKAKTDDKSAFGIIITDESDNKSYYVASSTLYNEQVINSIPREPFAAFVPVSGIFSCMNMADATRFARKINAEFSVPINYGMFDKIDPQSFTVPGKLIPRPYRVIEFNVLPINDSSPKPLDWRFNEKKIEQKEKQLDSALDLTSEQTIEVTTVKINAITDQYLEGLTGKTDKVNSPSVKEKKARSNEAHKQADIKQAKVSKKEEQAPLTATEKAVVQGTQLTPNEDDPYILTMDTDENSYTSSFVSQEMKKMKAKENINSFEPDDYSYTSAFNSYYSSHSSYNEEDNPEDEESKDLEKIDAFLERLEKRERGEDTSY